MKIHPKEIEYLKQSVRAITIRLSEVIKENHRLKIQQRANLSNEIWEMAIIGAMPDRQTRYS